MIRLIALVSLLHLVITVRAQLTLDLSSLDIEKNPLQWYDATVGEMNTGFFRGSYYDTREQAVRSHPYFLESYFVNGRVKVAGQVYEEVPLLYDIHSGELITKYPGNIGEAILLSFEEVEWFELDQSRFIKVNERDYLAPPSYYQILYQGDNLVLLAYRYKEIEQDYDNVTIYAEKTRFFVVIEGEMKHLDSPRKFVQDFPSYKNEIRRKIRLERRQSSKEIVLISVASFCDKL